VQTDSLFYQLFQNSPSVLFELLGNTDPRASTYSFSSQEVKQTSFRIDGILVPPIYARDLPIYFVEVQGYRDTKGDLYPSLFGEIFLYLNDYRPVNDWRAVVIFTKKSLDPGIPRHYEEFANNPRLQRIYLDELTIDEAESSLELGVLKLIGVKLDIAPEQARKLVARTTEELTDAAEQCQILELVETVLIYKFPERSRQEIEQMLGLNELKQTRVYQEALEEGLEQGRQEGRHEGELAVVMRQLTRRVGAIEPQLRSQLGQLSSAQLEELAEALLDFSWKADLVTWLDRQ
jgi:predicted transposase/invertase (TIGR01784 family)